RGIQGLHQARGARDGTGRAEPGIPGAPGLAYIPTGIERILRIDREAERHHGRPFLVRAAGLLVHLASQLVERGDILAASVDLEQLATDRVALGLLLERLLQDLLGLRLPTVGDVDLGLGDGIHLGRVHIDAAVADVGAEQAVRRIDVLPAGRAEERVRSEGVGAAQAVLEALG